ncbi:Por secretion system C-terminal sorting domain-containing protein [Filimonas lacunae]|uniref:Por secretion system C-terminal sorting domain-containing protein n=1 Tax=Filimonas lacunae TaxID=477680 RepID=A0A173MCK0_9BACT|nr:T9SS type A sorting domain-containing protein [Filimonas lacunae]BAV05304.1 endo-1,4-beta-xylanase A precursor [Filimonas lacunae]SIT22083.1 Por secretion system C-terminal sorting domain-containing protein [Filimonas lacunae]
MKKIILLVVYSLLVGTCLTAQTTGFKSGKIPMDSSRWYQLVNTTSGLGGLSNGITNEVIQTGWGKVLNQWDSYYPIADDEIINIDSIKMFDGVGINTDQPTTLSVITADWKRIPMATFTGSGYMQWVGPYPNRTYQAGDNIFKLDSTIHNPRYLVLTTYWAYPSELELYGTYKSSTKAVSAYKPKQIRMKQGFGVNAFEWNFENAADPSVISEKDMNMVKSFTGVRHYMDWEKLESKQGGYTFNPCHSGGWNYDTIYWRCKKDGIEVLADLKQLPTWLVATYPSADQNSENVPVPYGADFSNPASYILQAKVAFQYAARYGRNTKVPDALMKIDATTRWNFDPPNKIRKGLNYITYIECDNERNKPWVGRKGYQTGREYAANLSAFYDGHKHTLGADVGVKTADSTMQVVMAGLAGPDADFVKGMVDWCKEFRGYKKDGKVDLCWDIINYHFYSNNAAGTVGIAPEGSGAVAAAKRFLQLAHDYAYDMPVWVTEAGYDLNSGSPFHTVAIGNKNTQETQADWILRTALLYNRLGIDRVFFYMMYDDNANSGIQFASSGLINDNRTRRPSADFLYQTNKLLGQYIYQETMNNSPIVDRYALNGQNAYALMMPTQNNTVATYSLNVGEAGYVNVYTPTVGKDSMTVKRVTVPSSGRVSLQISETPIFAIPGGKRALPGDTVVTAPIDTLLASLQLYPNPTTNLLNVVLNNDKKSAVDISVYDFTGRLIKRSTYAKPDQVLRTNLNFTDVAAGMYLVEIRQSNERVSRGVLKY